jgi:hypothetical protein
MAERIATYEGFWPYYVSEHMRETTRRLHFVGTALVLGTLVAGILASPLWFIATPFAGYGFAWVGHFFVERNKPATFTYPLWSLRADFRMFRFMLLGRMAAEIERAARLYPDSARKAGVLEADSPAGTPPA